MIASALWPQRQCLSSAECSTYPLGLDEHLRTASAVCNPQLRPRTSAPSNLGGSIRVGTLHFLHYHLCFVLKEHAQRVINLRGAISKVFVDKVLECYQYFIGGILKTSTVPA